LKVAGDMINEEKELSFKATVNNIVFHIWSRKAKGTAESDIDTTAHMHYHSEFHYVYEGTEKILRSDTGEVTVIGAGDFCMIPQNVYHATVSEGSIFRQCFYLDIEYDGTHDSPEPSDYYLFKHILDHSKNIMVYRNEFVSAAMKEFRLLTETKNQRFDMQRGLMLLSSIMKTVERQYLATSDADIQ